ncbi:hypothetical protein HPC62_20145 [Thermoleptolyngbya sichuanensis A183]|uniref:Uncharacterized protein n=2 Tax=Thermoleptolyngbya TaxID=2303528 RepID=A0A6M8BC06_9CYAN|nr:hypothetical protein [Thermoleptolyngbya sichuanensis]QKD84178.1 hypothetical protein HPC62_20145 [Thermoleptolyngbya sichuanensis A183]
MSNDKQWWAAGANQINRWLVQNQLRSLDEAYRGALQIQELERQYFGGDRIAFRADLSKTVFDYVKTKRDRQLLRVRANLTRFRLSSFLQNTDVTPESAVPTAQEQQILEKLGFIERVIGKYRDLDNMLDQIAAEAGDETMADTTIAAPEPGKLTKDLRTSRGKVSGSKPLPPMHSGETDSSDSILNRLSSIGKELSKELSPPSEQEIVTELRLRRKQNRIALRWLAVLLLLPLLTQVLTKNLIFEPLLGSYSDRHPSAVELSTEIEEEFLAKFSEYREALEIRHLLKNYQPPVAEQSQAPFWQRNRSFFNQAIEDKTLMRSSADVLTVASRRPPTEPAHQLDGRSPGIAPGMAHGSPSRGIIVTTDLPNLPELRTDLEEEAREYQQALQEKAVELWREAREKQLDGLKNVLADLTSILVLMGLVYFGRDRLRLLGNFTNRTFLTLSDPAKVFLFILVTDIFVGFHSAEGWEVILEGVFHHFGLPESKVFINGFIATVPVFIDSCIKFWIFSYLTRYSPSASAIYERMNT